MSGPADLIQKVLNCDEETARTVQANLGGVMGHDATRAFIVRAWHLGNTTRVLNGDRDDYLICEGKRQAALFLVACARAGMALELYHDPTEGTEP